MIVNSFQWITIKNTTQIGSLSALEGNTPANEPKSLSSLLIILSSGYKTKYFIFIYEACSLKWNAKEECILYSTSP